MLPEPASSIVSVLLALGVRLTTILRTILGAFVICKAHPEDLPKVVEAMGTWFWKRGR